MSGWRTYRIADLGRVVTGKTPPSSQPELFDGTIPFLTPSDMSFDRRHSSTERFVSADWDSKGRTLLPEGAVCVVCIGATIGKICMSSQPTQTNQQLNSVIVDPTRFDSGFVYYVLRTKTDELKARAAGAATPIINKAAFSELEIDAPPLAAQRNIASILGAYDDLIEVNRRRIAVLEEMARGLFEEWFVHFRFPGHNAVPILDTPDGPLPEGWRRDRIGDVATYVNRGIAPKYDDEAETLVIGQKCIRDQRLSLALARRQSKKAPVEKIVQPGDVLINSTGTGTLGRVAQAEKVPSGLTVDSHVTIVRPSSPEDRDYLGLNLFAMQPVFEHLGAGSTNQTELARSAVQNQMLVWPPVDLRARFGRIVRPARELVEQLAQQNVSLAASRDLLLPRLISGQLSVPEAERQLEEAA